MKNIFIFLLFIHLSLSAFGQPMNNNLRLNLSFEKEEWELLEPWSFSLKATNNGSKAVKIYPFEINNERGSNLGYLELEKKGEMDSTWIITQCIINWHKEYGGPSFLFNPKDSIQATFFCPPAMSIKNRQLDVRAAYAPFGIGDTTRIYSNTVSLHLKEYKGQDLLAYKFIKDLPNPIFFLYPICSTDRYMDPTYVKYAEDIIDRFPKSSFASYCEVFSSSIYYGNAYNIARKEKDIERTLEYLRKSKKNALMAINSSNLRVKEYAYNILSWQLINIVDPLYNYDPPIEIEKEFTFTDKH